jgi:hypothetical protein
MVWGFIRIVPWSFYAEKEAKEGNGEEESKDGGEAVVSDSAPQAGAIVPATGPRPARVYASLDFL